MSQKFYQACYGHPKTGWTVLNASDDLPKELRDAFAAAERANAAAASRGPAAGERGDACMLELYCRNDALNLVRVQYQLSDHEGRPISFAHGYLFPDAYALLADPNEVLCVQKENFADQQIPQEQKRALQGQAGGLNEALIRQSGTIPETLSRKEAYTLSAALERCGMNAGTYRMWMKAVYAQIFTATAAQKQLYVRTDGSEEHALSLLYLTYLALPYSLRPLLSASTCLYKAQRNAQLLFCAAPPEDAPRIDPAAGETNVINEQLSERMETRYPMISAAVEYAMEGKQEDCFQVMEYLLEIMGDKRTVNLRDLRFAHTLYRILVYEEAPAKEEALSVFRQWLSYPAEGKNAESWDFVASCILNVMRLSGVRPEELSPETRTLLASRMKDLSKGRKAAEDYCCNEESEIMN